MNQSQTCIVRVQVLNRATYHVLDMMYDMGWYGTWDVAYEVFLHGIHGSAI